MQILVTVSNVTCNWGVGQGWFQPIPFGSFWLRWRGLWSRRPWSLGPWSFCPCLRPWRLLTRSWKKTFSFSFVWIYKNTADFFNEKFTELCYTLRWWEETIQSEEKPVKARGWRPKWVLLIWLGFLRLPVGFLQTFFSATMMEQARLKPKPLAKVFFPTWTLDIIKQFQLFLVRQ